LLFFTVVQCTREYEKPEELKTLLLLDHQVSTRVGVRTIRSLRWPCRSRDPRSGGTCGQERQAQSHRREAPDPFFNLIKTPLTTSRVSPQMFCLLTVCDSANVLFLYLLTSMSVTVSFNNLSVRLVLFINYFKLLQSLPTTQHIYELSLLSSNVRYYLFHRTESENFTNSNRYCWLTWKGLLWDIEKWMNVFYSLIGSVRSY
jgi:hypothetical protein